eukprot:GEMP01025796.1.p1 GENE.GEMP01025796.1~~GEMP01025796.1.p1  ORF type:complete len:279 (+),score=79.52 GEMP01025796.1:510-1346(+)
MQANHREKKIREGSLVPRSKKRGLPRLTEARDHFYQVCMERDDRFFEAAVTEVRAARAEVFGVQTATPKYPTPHPQQHQPYQSYQQQGKSYQQRTQPYQQQAQPYQQHAQPYKQQTQPYLQQTQPKARPMPAPQMQQMQMLRAQPKSKPKAMKVSKLNKLNKANAQQARPPVSTMFPPTEKAAASTENTGTSALPFLQHVRRYLIEKKLPPGEKINANMIAMDPEAKSLHIGIAVDKRKRMIDLLGEYPENFKVTRDGLDVFLALARDGGKRPIVFRS